MTNTPGVRGNAGAQERPESVAVPVCPPPMPEFSLTPQERPQGLPQCPLAGGTGLPAFLPTSHHLPRSEQFLHL